MIRWTCPTCGTKYQSPVDTIPPGPLASCRNRGCTGKPKR